MSYDEQAARRVVEKRAAWAVATASELLAHPVDAQPVAILAAKMLDQLPMVVPETPNDA